MAQIKTSYQEPKLEILFVSVEDVIKTSKGDDIAEDIFDF